MRRLCIVHQSDELDIRITTGAAAATAKFCACPAILQVRVHAGNAFIIRIQTTLTCTATCGWREGAELFRRELTASRSKRCQLIRRSAASCTSKEKILSGWGDAANRANNRALQHFNQVEIRRGACIGRRCAAAIVAAAVITPAIVAAATRWCN